MAAFSNTGMGNLTFGDVDVPSDLLEAMIKSESFNLPSELNLNNLLATGESIVRGSEPYLEILVQPRSRGYRFRYSSEGNTHGGIPGEGGDKSNKKFPTVHILSSRPLQHSSTVSALQRERLVTQVCNYHGPARICVSLVTGEDPPKTHAHNLVGKDTKHGFGLVTVQPETNMTASFTNLGIQHVTKKNIQEVLIKKLTNEQQMFNFSSRSKSSTGESFDVENVMNSFGLEPNEETVNPELVKIIAVEQMDQIRKEAKKLAQSMDQSVARLMFQAFLPDAMGKFSRALDPVISKPIHDQKAAHAGQLKICHISKSTSSVDGKTEVTLLCDKVQKDDIEVRFYQEDKQGNLLWEDLGEFGQSEVHKQCAIIFRTPPYWDRAIQKPVDVLLQLRRRKDQECSEPVPFQYKPTKIDPYRIGQKRRKTVPKELDDVLGKSMRPTASTSSAATFSSPTGIQTAEPENVKPPSNFGQINFFPPVSSAMQWPSNSIDLAAIQALFHTAPKSST